MVAEEDWCWDLNPVMAAMQSGNHKALAGGLGTICLWGASFLLHGLGSPSVPSNPPLAGRPPSVPGTISCVTGTSSS